MEYFLYSVFVLFMFFTSFVMCSVPAMVFYLVLLPFIVYFKKINRITNFFHRRLKQALICIVIFFSALLTYSGFFPDDSFFIIEYQSITNRDFPSTGLIQEKSASYPDMHGDYCSSSIVILSDAQWQNIRQQISQDPRFEVGEAVGSRELHKVLGSRQTLIGYVRKDQKSDTHLYIGFVESDKSLVLNRCSS